MVAARERGATLLEFAVAAVILGVVVTVLLDRLRFYQEAAEKNVVETTVLNLRAGLRYREAELMLRGRERDIPRLVGANPIAWLAAPPNYLGERKCGGLDAIPRGYWCFDVDRRELIYRVKLGDHFVPGPSGEWALRLRAVATALSGDNPLVSPSIEGVTLIEVGNYRWF